MRKNGNVAIPYFKYELPVELWDGEVWHLINEPAFLPEQTYRIAPPKDTKGNVLTIGKNYVGYGELLSVYGNRCVFEHDHETTSGLYINKAEAV